MAASLHGPARHKARLLAELRDGLDDAVAEHTGEGLSHADATARALRDIGTPDVLIPVYQHELTIAQARHTARAAAVTAPFTAACWLLTHTAEHGGAGSPYGAALLLAVHLVAVATVAAVLTAASLAATGRLARRLPTPPRLPLAVAWTGTAASVAMALTTLLLLVLALLGRDWPLAVGAGGLAAASHALVASSARACRRCVRLVTG
ncbi:hypothetical protein HPT28_00815 [Streptomyces sp. JJ38]|nr:hypothetical protein [Streptomyces sp. JJ38]